MAPANLLSPLFLLALLSSPLILTDARAVPFSSFSKATNTNTYTPELTTPNTINTNNYQVAATTTSTPNTYNNNNNKYEAATTTPSTFYDNNYEGTTTAAPKNYKSDKYSDEEVAATATTLKGNPYDSYNNYEENAASTATGNNYYYNNNRYQTGEQYTEKPQTSAEPVFRNTAYSADFRPGTTIASASTATTANKYYQNDNVNTEAVYKSGNQQQWRQGEGMSDTRTLNGGIYWQDITKEPEQHQINNPQFYSNYKEANNLPFAGNYYKNEQSLEAGETVFQP